MTAGKGPFLPYMTYTERVQQKGCYVSFAAPSFCLFLRLYRNSCHFFIKCHHAAVVFPAAAFLHEAFGDLLDHGCQQQWDVQFLCRFHDVIDIFHLAFQESSGSKIAAIDTGCFLFQYGTASQAAPHGFIHLLWVCTGLLGQHQGFGDGSNIDETHDLVAQFCHRSGPVWAGNDG